LFAKSKATKLKFKVKKQSTTNFFTFAKKFASKTLLINVNIYQIFFDFNVDSNIASNSKFNSNKNIDNKTFINIVVVTKIFLNKKDRVIASKIVNYCKYCFLDKKFKTIQETKEEEEKNCLL